MKKPLFGLLFSAIFAVAPLIVTFMASAIANFNGCKLHEGYSNPCITLGIDIGELLYGMGISLWLAFVTVPLGILAGIVCFVWLLVIIYKQKK